MAIHPVTNRPLVMIQDAIFGIRIFLPPLKISTQEQPSPFLCENPLTNSATNQQHKHKCLLQASSKIMSININDKHQTQLGTSEMIDFTMFDIEKF